MRRFALFAVLQWFGVMAFSQSMTIPPGTPQASPDKPSAFLPLSDFNKRQFGQFATSTQADKNQLFRVPPMNPNTLLAMAGDNSPNSLLTEQQPKGKAEPIPTQWPNAKAKPIPTTWPNLKLQLIEGHNASPVPVK